MSASRSPVPGYGLAAPSEQDIVAALGKSLGPSAPVVWQAARVTARVGVGVLSLDALETVCKVVASGGGVAGITARSFIVRIGTYRFLSSQQAPQASGMAVA